MSDCRTGKCGWEGCGTCRGVYVAIKWRLVHEPTSFQADVRERYFNMWPDIEQAARIYAEKERHQKRMSQLRAAVKP